MNIVGIGASEAKRAVAQSKARAREDMYDKLEKRKGEERIFAIAREMEKSTKNFTYIKQVKNKEGRVLVSCFSPSSSTSMKNTLPNTSASFFPTFNYV